MKCPQCDGTGKVEKPVSMDRMELVDCDMCEGTGQLDDSNEVIIKKLDRIIKLLELIAKQITGGK